MTHRIFLTLALLMLTTGVAANDEEPQAQGNATVAVGDNTASWPIWQCARIVLAHQLPEDDIRTDNHLKLIDYGDVIQMVLKLADKVYMADIPASQNIHSLDYEGSATSINSVNLTDAGTATFSLQLECSP